MTLKPPIHGRDHRPGRSDPIPGVIVYEYENLGGWLYVQTDDNRPPTHAAIQFETNGTGSDAQILLNNGTSLIQVTDLTARVQSNQVIVHLVDQDSLVGDSFIVSTTPNTAPHLGVRLQVFTDGTTDIRFSDAGSNLNVYDTAGGAIMRLDEDGTLHLKAGANIVNDL